MPESTLSEYDSKQLLARYGVPVCREERVAGPEQAVAAAERIGLPVVVKLCGDAIAHKTERDLVRLGLATPAAVRAAAQELLARARPEDGEVALLVAEQVAGRRELIAGLTRDPQFGACVVLGLGGILTEALGDVVFAAAPLEPAEARAMIGRLRAAHLVTQPFRGEPAADRDALAEVLVALSRLAEDRPDVLSVDVNPLILREGRPVAVDGLVEVAKPHPGSAPGAAGRAARRATASIAPPSDEALRERYRPLFDPRGIVVAGVSSHPGKFGFVAYHNLLRFGYRGKLFPIHRKGEEILGRPTLREVAEVPAGEADLVFRTLKAGGTTVLLDGIRIEPVR